MSELRDLYQELILDHNKNPRNFRVMENATNKIDGFNPLCGDKITLYVQKDGKLIRDISFQGSGCAISKASASMMTAAVKGKSQEEAEKLFENFHEVVTGKEESEKVMEELGKLSAFAGVREFPARVKCATLAWHTLRSALENKNESVSTE